MAAEPRGRMALRLFVCSLLAAPLLLVARPASPASTGLVAAFGFDEGSGSSVADASGSGNTGTVQNGTWAAGKFGKALQFNGSNTRVNVPDSASLHLTTGMTLEAWVDPSTVNGAWRDVIYKGNDNYYLEATSDNASRPDAGLIAGGSYGDAFGSAALPANSWSYLAETYDGSTLRLYVNGTQVASTAHTGSIATSTNQLQIGGDGIWGQYFAGLIDEVRIYNVALTAAQIQADQTAPINPTGPDTQPPTGPASLTATAVSAGEVDLSWPAATDNVGVTGYRVERCQGASCSSFAQIATPTATTYKDTSLTAGAAYSYRVRATDAAGNLGPYSPTAAATTPTPDTQPPTGPTALTATAVSAGEIDLSWPAASDNVGVSGYQVERCAGASCSSFAQIATNGLSALSYKDTTVAASTSYSYRVRATDAAGNLGSYTPTATATTPAPTDTQPPAGPASLSATVVSAGEVDLSWPPASDNVGVTGYRVERCTGASCSGFSQIATTGGSPTSFRDTTVAAGTSYGYRIRATDAAGNLGSYTPTASATTPAATGQSGLVAAYAFDEGSGTSVADQSGNGNTGTVQNGTWGAAGKFGKALQFNGSSTRVNVPDAASLHLTTGMTLEAWVNPSTVNGAWRDVIYKGNDNYYLEATSSNGSKPDGGLIAGGSYADAFGTSALPANSWSFLAETYDGSTLRLYVNGTQVASTAHTGAISTSTNQLQIGGDSLYGQYFAGMIDEVRVYNTALSATQIQADQTTPITAAGPTFSVGGSLSGLSSGSVVVQDNGGDDLTVSANGSFAFATKLPAGAAYSVTVKTNPAGQSCTVSNGSGTVGSANVTGVTVSCVAVPTYSVGGSLSGLSSGSAVVQDNGGDDLTVSANGSFVFATKLASGAAYAVTVKTNPAGQTCSVANGSGTVGSASVTTVAVACSTSSGSTVSDDFNRADGGLGANWTAVSDGGLSISSQAVLGSSATAGDIRTGESYASDQSSQVEVTSTQLSGGQWIGPAVRMQNGGQDQYLGIYFWNNGTQQLRLYERSAGTWIQLGNSYNSGALAAGTQLQLTAVGSTITFLQNGVARITATDASITGGAPGIMTFGTAKADNWVGGGAGATAPPTYSVGGAVSGLAGTVVLQDNGGDDLGVGANGPFTFATKLPSGVAYAVTVKSNPAGQTCSVANGSGTVGSANITGVAVTCSAQGATGSDDFNRADGGLGPNWSAVGDGGLSISSQAVVGTSATAGDIRIGESYPSDQSSQVEVTSTQLTGGQWIGPAVRMQNGGQNMYLGIYFWNNGSQELRIYERNAGTWTQLGGSYGCGPLAPGTQLQLSAVGSTITFFENGVARLSVSDSTITGGAPGIMTFGTATGDNWVGATGSGSSVPAFQADYTGTDANGVASYSVVSADDGYGPQVLRVLAPTNPAPGMPHNFVYVLPVEGGLATDYGDGLDTLRALDAQDQYNLTIIEPTFEIDPWYANNPNDPNLQYETFMTKDLVPWVTTNLSTSGHEQSWLIGFSKSGIGGEDLLLKHPDVFALAASWDFPADMPSYDYFGSSSADEYGTDANFQANYRLTSAFVDAHKAPFQAHNRIWIGSYQAFQTDVSDYDALLTAKGILHTTETPQLMAHRWDSGWVPIALAALHQDGLNLPSGS
ncbi:MAG TPA: LamG-like jellyroll fold domain-containing protein [Gaiellaceae bacterium]